MKLLNTHPLLMTKTEAINTAKQLHAGDPDWRYTIAPAVNNRYVVEIFDGSQKVGAWCGSNILA